MNDETTRLKAENERLVARVAELERELAALKAKSQPPPKPRFERQTLEILKCFFDTGQILATGQIALHFNLAQSIAKHHLDVLVANGCVAPKRNPADTRTPGGVTGFVITPVGRAVLTNSSV